MIHLPPADLGRRFERLRLATPQGMESLCASIRAEGILSPLAASECDGRTELLDGFKRLRVAAELQLETVPVTPLSFPSHAAMVAAVLLLNTRARSVTGLDEALVIRALAEEDRLTLVQIGALLGRDKSFCSRRLKLARDLDPGLVHMVREGALPVSTATLLAVLPRGNQHALGEAIVREGLSKRETQQLIALAAEARGRARELLLAQPRAAIGQLDRRRAGGCPAGNGARSGLVYDVRRATELLARVARGLGAIDGRGGDATLEAACRALRAQVAVVEAQLGALAAEAAA